MAYKEVLSELIKNSNLSLREISNRCKNIGVSISASYICQIRTGKLSPPSQEISIAISKVCNADSNLLLFESFKEKIPDNFKNYFQLDKRYFLPGILAAKKIELIDAERQYELSIKMFQYKISSLERQIDILEKQIDSINKNNQ